MFCFNLPAAVLVIAYIICNVGAAPLRVSSISSRPRIVEARQQPSNTCTMTTAMMSYNLAGAMVTMTSVQADVNDTMVQAVQEGIMGAMMSLTMLNGAMSSGASVPSYLSSAMVGNITMSLNYIDTITGVPTVAAAANLDEARQQLQNADQFAMMVSASCGAESTSAAPSASSARPSATPSTTASA